MASEKKVKSPASKFGQIIGEVFEEAVIEFVRQYLAEKHAGYELLSPEEGKRVIRLEMIGGLPRQMDNVVVLKNTTEPIALLETKWLKDARHHNDKGAWILQLREVRKKYPTIRGAAAVLAGYWTEGVGLMLLSEGGIKMILVATDDQIYSTLQSPLDNFLGDNSFNLNAATMRESYERPEDLLNLILQLQSTGHLKTIAQSWLKFERFPGKTGADLVKNAIDELLAPLPSNPMVQKFEITLQINTGNTIHAAFTDLEDAQEFLQTLAHNPQAILQRITPRPNLLDD
ncbi:MAG: hypothetical protein KJ064_19175 [Anaerolineae bacterium]|nr:hypothetical protein [Anaerolineae bacterium]